MEEHYSLIFYGEIALGHDPNIVRHKVHELLKVAPSRLENLFSGQKVYIKKGLTLNTVERCKKMFEATGAIGIVERDAPAQPTQPQIQGEEMMRCPKCGLEQQNAISCLGCGIVIAKYQRRQESLGCYGASEDEHTSLDGPFGPAMPSSSAPGRGKSFGGFVRSLMVITLLAACGYLGYRQIMGNAEGNIVFTSNDCGEPCQSALSHLKQAGVAFTELNVDASETNLAKFMTYRTNSLPLGIIQGKTLIGYNRASFQATIDELQGKYLEESANAVVMYSTQGCGYCRRAREFFAAHNIRYIENDIADPNNRLRYENLGGRGVPLILISGTRIDGFQQQTIIAALREAELM